MALFASNLAPASTDRALGSAVIQRSLRFNRDDAAHLTYTPASASTDRTKITISAWVKKCGIEQEQNIFHAGTSSDGRATLRYYHSGGLDCLSFFARVSGSFILQVDSSAKFRDTNAWYHVVARCDTTNGTANIYVNGEDQTLATSTKPSGSQNLPWFNNIEHQIGERGYDGSGTYMNGYMAEINVIQGQALDPSYFGFTDPVTGIWMPKRYEGTYGDGFYLDFSDNTSTTTLGIDKSPNGNDFTANNFSVSAGAGNDSLEDTPTNNFPTFNPINSIKYSNDYSPIVEQGNLLMRGGDNYSPTTFLLPKSGKWYVEFSKYGNGAIQSISVTRANKSISGYDGSLGLADMVQYVSNGELGNRSRGSTSNATAWTDDADIVVAIAVDMDNGAVYFARANTWQNSGDPTSGANKTGAMGTDIKTDNSGDHVIAAEGYNGNDNYGMYVNFGQRPFTYTPPTGYRSLCTKNLPPNVPSVVRPQKYFDTILYTGDGSTQSVSGLEFKPDFVWIKERSSGSEHKVFDVVRGVQKGLTTAGNGTEEDQANYLTKFHDHGFVVGNDGAVNENSQTYVSWCWKAGGTAVSNDDGSITSSVSANQTSGFSIITYTGTGSAATIGHGLGKAPKLIWVKNRTTTQDWFVNNGMILNDLGKYYKLNSSGSSNASDTNVFPNTAPTSTVFSVGGDNAVNGSGDNYLAYVWSEIPGFSQFGYWTGNGNTNGSYIHTGFTPKLIIYRKESDTNWHMLDTQRDSLNPNTAGIDPNLPNAEADDSNLAIDFLSSGFKLRTSHSTANGSGTKYVYYTWAGQSGVTPFDTFPNAR